ncbi:WD40 repeat domain-containing protein [Fervidibacter sacchari]|uniref:WD40 repeat domain-containing protein n=1 Tax=Candidatus Fervidibacter sacchari TaxID=1448929 RepID=UPI003898FA13
MRIGYLDQPVVIVIFKLRRLIFFYPRYHVPIGILSDGQHLISASWDGTVRLWKVSDGAKIDELCFNCSVRFVTLSPNGQLLAISTYDPTIRLWRLPDKTLL